MSKYLPVENPTTPFWHSEPTAFHNQVLDKLPEEVDVIIVGSGYAGTTTAHYLLKDNVAAPNVLMLEARSVCSGATARNGGHLKPDVYRSYLSHAEKFGPRAAAEIINFENDHIAAMATLVLEEKLDCDFIITRACDIDLVEEQVEKSIAGFEAVMKNPYVKNKEQFQLLRGEAAKTISKNEQTEVCITYPAGSIWPYKMVTGLLAKLLAKENFKLQTNTPVLKTEKLADGKFLVKTSRGDVLCKQLVLATNAYTKSVAPEFDGKITPIKGLCSHIKSADSLKRAPNLVNSYGLRYEGSFIDYLINRPDGSIIVGGAKQHIFPFPEKFLDTVDDSFIIENTDKYFENYMQDHFYTWKDFKTTMDYCWSGILGYSDDGLPYVGESTTEKDKFILAGFHGHGMPRVLLCAQALAKCMREGKSITETCIPESFQLTEKRMNLRDSSRLQQTISTSSDSKA